MGDIRRRQKIMTAINDESAVHSIRQITRRVQEGMQIILDALIPDNQTYLLGKPPQS